MRVNVDSLAVENARALQFQEIDTFELAWPTGGTLLGNHGIPMDRRPWKLCHSARESGRKILLVSEVFSHRPLERSLDMEAPLASAS